MAIGVEPCVSPDAGPCLWVRSTSQRWRSRRCARGSPSAVQGSSPSQVPTLQRLRGGQARGRGPRQCWRVPGAHADAPGAALPSESRAARAWRWKRTGSVLAPGAHTDTARCGLPSGASCPSAGSARHSGASVTQTLRPLPAGHGNDHGSGRALVPLLPAGLGSMMLNLIQGALRVAGGVC